MANLVTYGFKEPKRVLGQVDTDAMAKVIAAAADISLIVDRKGVILDVAFGSPEFEIDGHQEWIGQKWVDTVTVESRPKVEEMLEEAAANRPSRWRQVNYARPGGEPSGADDIPVLYSAVQAGSKRSVIVLGRELRSMAELQQRLMSTQQSVEREYARLRQLETRYKLLFQIATEAVVIVDAATMRIVELNPTAANLLKRNRKTIEGSAFLNCFDENNEQIIQQLLANVRGQGSTQEAKVSIKGKPDPFMASATLLRQGDDLLFLVRLLPDAQQSVSGEVAVSDMALHSFVERLPDGFVVASATGIILSANSAFVEMVRAATEEQVLGVS
ncbi:MAG: PAS domain-containing protein, partial [Alphaproteobacteria bacterium]|nr:PAS domain-containing protein [Alphaproteobacteria bacterium]